MKQGFRFQDLLKLLAQIECFDFHMLPTLRFLQVSMSRQRLSDSINKRLISFASELLETASKSSSVISILEFVVCHTLENVVCCK